MRGMDGETTLCGGQGGVGIAGPQVLLTQKERGPHDLVAADGVGIRRDGGWRWGGVAGRSTSTEIGPPSG